MSEPEPTKIAVLGEIKTRDGGSRLVGRLADGKYQLGELATEIGFDGKPSEKFHTMTPAVSFADCAKLAEDVIAGRDRMTGRDALILALGFAAISCEFQFPSAAASPGAAVPPAEPRPNPP